MLKVDCFSKVKFTFSSNEVDDFIFVNLIK